MAIVVEDRRTLVVMANGTNLTEEEARKAANDYLEEDLTYRDCSEWSFTEMQRLAADTIEVHYT